MVTASPVRCSAWLARAGLIYHSEALKSDGHALDKLPTDASALASEVPGVGFPPERQRRIAFAFQFIRQWLAIAEEESLIETGFVNTNPRSDEGVPEFDQVRGYRHGYKG
jgi:hypothetical protein